MHESVLAFCVSAIWQGALLALAGAAAARLLSRASATARHALWSCVLLLACVMPVVTSLAPSTVNARTLSPQNELAAAPRAGADMVAAPGSRRVRAEGPLPVPGSTAAGPGETKQPAVVAAGAADAARGGFARTARRIITVALPPALVRVAPVAYLSVVSMLILLLAIDLMRIERLKRRSQVLPRYTIETLRSSLAGHTRRHHVALRASTEIGTPVFAGLIRPVILLPARLAEELSLEQLSQVVAHELAHAERRDDWRALAERVVRIALFFSPALPWICRRIALEREMSCDEWVLAHTVGTPDAYASTLLRIAERSAWSHRPQYASALTGSCLARRVEWLLDVSTSRRAPTNPWRIALMVFLLGTAALLSLRSPALAFTGIGTPTLHEPAPAVARTATGREAHPDAYTAAAAIDSLQAAGYSGAVLVAVQGRTVVHRGFGVSDRTTRAPAGPETLFNSGALAKSLTAAAILRLEEQGRLSVSDRVSRWLGDMPESKRNVTIHDLLIHAGGLTRRDAPVLDADRTRFIERVKAAPIDFPSGTRLRHTDVGYSMLAIIVENVSGMPYERYVRTELLQRAGMRHTFFQDEPGARAAAVEYSATGDARSAVAVRPYAWGRRGAMGIYSTVADLYRWQQALQNGLLSSRSLARMHSVGIRNPWGSVTGYGGETRTASNGAVVTHLLSSWPGNSVELMHDPGSDITIALIIDNRVDWSNPRYIALLRIIAGAGGSTDFRHLLRAVREPA